MRPRSAAARWTALPSTGLGAAVRSIAGLCPPPCSPPVRQRTPSLAPADRAGLRNLVLALGDVVGGAEQNGTLEKLRLRGGGASGTIDSITIGTDAAAKDGLLDASLRSPWRASRRQLIPDGPLSDYVPRRLAAHPHISGVPASDLIALLLRAIDSDHSPCCRSRRWRCSPRARSGWPRRTGFDLGDARLQASGMATIAAPDNHRHRPHHRHRAGGADPPRRHRARTAERRADADPGQGHRRTAGRHHRVERHLRRRPCQGERHRLHRADAPAACPGAGGRPPARRPNGPAR